MTLLLVQMTVVLLVTVFCGWLARKLGQARVIGEIIGGILIGPSVFGRFTPHWSATLFPASSFNAFDILSTVGLILFLFLDRNGTGLRTALQATRHRRHGERNEHCVSLCHGSTSGPLTAHSICSAWNRQHSICSFSRYFHEHHGVPGARPHHRRTAHAGYRAGNHRDHVRGSGRCRGVDTSGDRSGADRT